MSAITAIYEDGVFRPTEPVTLPERCEVELEYHVRPAANGADGFAADWEIAAQELQKTGYDFDTWERQRATDVENSRSRLV